MTHSIHNLQGNQTRGEEIFTRLTTPWPQQEVFVTHMLTRDLLVVANIFVTVVLVVPWLFDIRALSLISRSIVIRF